MKSQTIWSLRGAMLLAMIASAALDRLAHAADSTHSTARLWNEQHLEAIRQAEARPPVHARTLYHVAAAMYDAWAAFDPTPDQVFHHEKQGAIDAAAARDEAISFAAFRVLNARFATSTGAADSLEAFRQLMIQLGYDPDNKSISGDTPAVLGNRVAITVLAHGLSDGANEAGNFANQQYEPVNPPLEVYFLGNPEIIDPNRWQPLIVQFTIDILTGRIVPVPPQPAIAPEWGNVAGFSLSPADRTIHVDERGEWNVYHDPGPPPQIGGDGDDIFRWGHQLVPIWHSHHDSADGVVWDISPGAIGATQTPATIDELHQLETFSSFYDFFEGGDNGDGHAINPATGLPYSPQLVPRGDYSRVVAEFWSGGPNSESLPVRWFTILNHVSDHPLLERRFGGSGPVLDDLEWDVKTYLALGAALHESAIQCWSLKGWHDSARVISALRFIADNGQSSNPDQASYDINGIELFPGLIELITAQTTAPGAHHEMLAGYEGSIALRTWRGPLYVADPRIETAGVGWILAGYWWPFQDPQFVTPQYPGYSAEHSTFGRAAARVMQLITGNEYFPGGLGEQFCPAHEFLAVEDGPSIDVVLQWATYRDAADQSGLASIWGGLHPSFDDLPGRLTGDIVGDDALHRAARYFHGAISCPEDIAPAETGGDGVINAADLAQLLARWGPCGLYDACIEDVFPTFDAGHGDRDVNAGDLAQLLVNWGQCTP